MEWMAMIVVGGLSFIGTIVGAYTANRKSTALIAYRLDKVEKNQQSQQQEMKDYMTCLNGRMYAAEQKAEILHEKIKVANNRIDDLEKGGN